MPESKRLSVILTLDTNGVLRALDIRGHAGSAPKGANIPCAGATLLAKTAYETLRALPGLRFSGEAPEPGILGVSLESYGEENQGQLRGVTEFLKTGFIVLSGEYPQEVLLEIKVIGG